MVRHSYIPNAWSEYQLDCLHFSSEHTGVLWPRLPQQKQQPSNWAKDSSRCSLADEFRLVLLLALALVFVVLRLLSSDCAFFSPSLSKRWLLRTFVASIIVFRYWSFFNENCALRPIINDPYFSLPPFRETPMPWATQILYLPAAWPLQLSSSHSRHFFRVYAQVDWWSLSKCETSTSLAVLNLLVQSVRDSFADCFRLKHCIKGIPDNAHVVLTFLVVQGMLLYCFEQFHWIVKDHRIKFTPRFDHVLHHDAHCSQMTAYTKVSFVYFDSALEFFIIRYVLTSISPKPTILQNIILQHIIGSSGDQPLLMYPRTTRGTRKWPRM